MTLKGGWLAAIATPKKVAIWIRGHDKPVHGSGDRHLLSRWYIMIKVEQLQKTLPVRYDSMSSIFLAYFKIFDTWCHSRVCRLPQEKWPLTKGNLRHVVFPCISMDFRKWFSANFIYIDTLENMLTSNFMPKKTVSLNALAWNHWMVLKRRKVWTRAELRQGSFSDKKCRVSVRMDLSTQTNDRHWYCWWKKSCITWDVKRPYK